jgi:hypothetical protein
MVLLCGLQSFTLLLDKPLNFFLRNVKEATLYLIVSYFLLWNIFIYNFLHGVYMELQLDLPLLFTGDVSMVSIDVHFSQLGDEDVALTNVEPKYYCHDLLKPSGVSPLHVGFGLRGIFGRQGNFFKPCTLTLAEWYRNLLAIF